MALKQTVKSLPPAQVPQAWLWGSTAHALSSSSQSIPGPSPLELPQTPQTTVVDLGWECTQLLRSSSAACTQNVRGTRWWCYRWLKMALIQSTFSPLDKEIWEVTRPRKSTLTVTQCFPEREELAKNIREEELVAACLPQPNLSSF